ncbi:MAG TPA: lipid A deacylase LpxR family protein [Rhizobacter sp.]
MHVALGAATTFSLLVSLALPAFACHDHDGERARPVLNIRLDNDALGFDGQDRGYTSGFEFGWMSANLARAHDPDCVPNGLRGARRLLDALHPQDYDQRNFLFTLTQAIYTPSDGDTASLLVRDRPYAAVLLLGVGYNARQGERLRATQVRVGMVGPSARGREVQNSLHDVIGVKQWQGWDHQLRDEPVLQVVHERLRRYGQQPFWGSRFWSWDLVTHYGGSIGNYLTHANVGAEWRIGRGLPDDFGSDPLRPAGENTAPVLRQPSGEWEGHFFASLDVRAVAWNITLDGNTWKDSHSVDKRPLVADLGVGTSLTVRGWKLALAHYWRTREFKGQEAHPMFGSITASRRF